MHLRQAMRPHVSA